MFLSPFLHMFISLLNTKKLSGRGIMMSVPKIVLSFDDGRLDNYDVVKPILDCFGISATFNIATAFVDGTIEKENAPCLNDAMSVENVKDLYASGYEIAGHGDNHLNTIKDFQDGIIKLRKWLNLEEQVKIGIASPKSGIDIKDIHTYGEWFQRNVAYIRTGIKDPDSFLRRVERKVAHLGGNSRLYVDSFAKSIGLCESGFVFYSIPIMHKATEQQVLALINTSERQNKDCVLMFHSILSEGDRFYEDTWSWDKKKFEHMCEYLKIHSDAGLLKIVKLAELADSKMN